MIRMMSIAVCRLSYCLSRLLHSRPLGLGIALRAIRSDFGFTSLSRRFWFDHRVAAAYALLPAGVSNEPETVAFLKQITTLVELPCTFVDVGASIGEFVMLAAGLPRVTGVVAFEPQQACCDAIRRSAVLNRFEHIEVRQAAVTDHAGQVYFSAFSQSPTCASVAPGEVPGAAVVESLTLDDVFGESQDLSIMLIDVEGAELQVVRGGRKWIHRNRPLIIFEYNKTTQCYFRLEEMTSELGSAYTLYRLRSDGSGRLDRNLADTWNIVAVPSDGPFTAACRSLVLS